MALSSWFPPKLAKGKFWRRAKVRWNEREGLKSLETDYIPALAFGLTASRDSVLYNIVKALFPSEVEY